MSVIILLLIASISVATLFLGAFLWGAKNGQFSDDYAPPRRILFDEPPPGRKAEPQAERKPERKAERRAEPQTEPNAEPKG